MNNNEKIDSLQEELSLLRNELYLLRDEYQNHRHIGTDSQKLSYEKLRDLPTITVNDSDIVFTDITTGNASTSNHGFLKKLSGTATEFLDGTGAFDTIKVTDVHVSASDTLISSANTERTTTSLTYVKKKDIEVNVRGTIRIKFDLRDEGASGSASGRVYKNDVAIGTVRTTSSGNFQTYTEDFSCVPGDNFQLYIKRDVVTSFQAGCQNFRVYYDTFTIPTVVTD